MSRWEIENLGDTIRDIVEEAVDSRNFQELNQTISRVVNQGVDYIQDSIQGKVKPHQAWTPKAAVVPKRDLFVNSRGLQAPGIALLIVGIILTLVFSILALVFGILLGVGVFALGSSIVFSISLVFIAGAIVCICLGGSRMKLAAHFKRYVSYLSDKTYSNLRDLAGFVHLEERVVLKDIKKMISKRWFKEGHLDDEQQCLMLTDEMYQEYCQLKAQRAALQQKEREQQRKDEMFGNQNPQVMQVLQEGEALLKELRQCNEVLPGQAISEKISRMEMLSARIFERIRQRPEQVDEIQKLLKYYLPTALKLLHAYEELDRQTVQGENIIRSKAEIEQTLDTLNAAFEKLLDGLFEDVAWDVSSDISVLNTMLAQEGLKDDGSNFRDS